MTHTFIAGNPISRKMNRGTKATKAEKKWTETIERETEHLEEVSECKITLVFHILEENWGTHGSDLDNLSKVVLDGLKRSALSKPPHDALVMELRLKKFMVTSNPGVDIYIC